MTSGRNKVESAPPVLIAGAGIGGLTAALALAQSGHSVTILEKRTQLEPIGAGIQLSPNASRVLIGLGLGPALMRAAGEPQRIMVRHATKGTTLSQMPLGQSMRDRFGAPYLAIHRADLQTILLDAIRGTPGVRLLVGRPVAEVKQNDTEVEVICDGPASKNSFKGSCLIGADGLWSRTAPALGDLSEPNFSGFEAWRATIPIEDAPPLLQGPETGLWLSTGSHLVHYPVNGGKSLNLVAVLDRGRSEIGWSQPGDPAVLGHRFRGSHKTVKALIDAVPEWQVWSLFDRKPRSRWTKGRVTLLGDAAHPVLPFVAQGGACSIEDAAVLALLLSGRPLDPQPALLAYEAARRPRATAIQLAARRTGAIYHMRGPLRLARDIVMQNTSGSTLLKRYEWIYGWRPETAV